eukprot:TRINITY_DN5251_c0_g1_i2.p1 TRINITY_DN5251_c0_g1~~TRINITY_DN5251_c0_g1_i2.p1  ORF type:complete len:591 (+),score=79.35 TRINITY_DN5251_c0_g1_i2:172-1944(+)
MDQSHPTPYRTGVLDTPPLASQAPGVGTSPVHTLIHGSARPLAAKASPLPPPMPGFPRFPSMPMFCAPPPLFPSMPPFSEASPTFFGQSASLANIFGPHASCLPESMSAGVKPVKDLTAGGASGSHCVPSPDISNVTPETSKGRKRMMSGSTDSGIQRATQAYWAVDTTKVLIQVVHEKLSELGGKINKDGSKDGKAVMKRHHWDEVADELAFRLPDSQFSHKQCFDKYNNLKSRYQSERLEHGATGKSSWEFFDLMHSRLGGQVKSGSTQDDFNTEKDDVEMLAEDETPMATNPPQSDAVEREAPLQNHGNGKDPEDGELSPSRLTSMPGAIGLPTVEGRVNAKRQKGAEHTGTHNSFPSMQHNHKGAEHPVAMIEAVGDMTSRANEASEAANKTQLEVARIMAAAMKESSIFQLQIAREAGARQQEVALAEIKARQEMNTQNNETQMKIMQLMMEMAEVNRKLRTVAKDLKGLQAAQKRTQEHIMVPEVNIIYRNCPVTTIAMVGAFVEVTPGKEGFCHISELSLTRLTRVEDAVKEGDLVDVKVLEVTPRGQMRLSRKAVLLEEEQAAQAANGTMPAPATAGAPKSP